MRVLHGPTAIYCDAPGNRGMTAFAIIETSHIAFHSWDEGTPNVIQLDVYSCSEFEPEVVFAALRPFEPIEIDFKFLDRTAGMQEVVGGAKPASAHRRKRQTPAMTALSKG